MEITDPRFLVEKPKKERTPAQKAATAKGLAVLKERRAAAAARVPSSAAPVAAPVAMEPAPRPPVAMEPAPAVIVRKLPAKKKKRVVYVEEESSSSSSSEEEVVVRRKKPTLPPIGTPLALSIPVVPDTRPPPVPVAPVKPAHIARSAVLSRLFDKN